MVKKGLSKEDLALKEVLKRATRELEQALRIAHSVRGPKALRTQREITALLRGTLDVGQVADLVEDPRDSDKERPRRYWEKPEPEKNVRSRK